MTLTFRISRPVRARLDAGVRALFARFRWWHATQDVTVKNSCLRPLTLRVTVL